MKHSHVINLLWRVALQEAVAARSQFIEPEHFFEALTKGGDFCREDVLKELLARGLDANALAAELRFVPELLESEGINSTQLRRRMRALLGTGTYEHTPGAVMHRSARARDVFKSAEYVATKAGLDHLHAGALLVAILSEKESSTWRLLATNGHDGEKIKVLAVNRLNQQNPGAAPGGGADKQQDSEAAVAPRKILEQFGRDLTKAAKDGLLPPVIGRRKELLQVIQTLARSSKSNPVLIGEAGVGKTAIVEALAQRAAAGKEEQVLGGRRIIEINMSAMVAGTKYRGEFEQRMQKLLEEVKADPNIILFIDEIHTLVGAGDRSGPMDAANIMKPALARGDFKCIGATTTAEYHKFIERDPALERRFNKIIVAEPSRDETVEILKGLRPRFEKHHQATISDEAIEAAVDLTIRFDTERYLPDKAVDVLDLACVQRCVPGLSIQGAVGQNAKLDAASVTLAEVIAVLAEKYGIPEEVIAGAVGSGEQSSMAGLRESLKKRVMGQDQAIEQVYKRLRLSYAALSDRRRPLGVFLFLGPSGVGKTELARALADTLFGAGQHLIRLDMSEYMEPHNVARLIGSPPGYIGHDEKGQLTGKLRKAPHALVLLDEIEKADPKVLDLFLQVFDEGRITDSKGKTIDAKNAVFIMTSNLGSKAPAKRPAALGFNAVDAAPEEEGIHEDVKKHFRTEMLNRIDEVVRFNPLTDDALAAIANDMLGWLAQTMQDKHQITLRIDAGVVEVLCKKAASAEFGARNLRRVIQDEIELPVIELLGSTPVATIRCRVVSEAIIVDITGSVPIR